MSTTPINETEWRKQLEQEGYQKLNLMYFGPNAPLHPHTHLTLFVQILLEGELIVFEGKNVQAFKAGDRFDVPKGTEHHAKAGPSGLKMLVGVKF